MNSQITTRFDKPLKIFKALLAAWGILFQFVIIIGIFVGAYFGLTYLNIPILNTIMYIVTLVVAGLSVLAMIFRVVDYLLEME